ncbi:MAG: ribosomal-processing cysteine protease Prp [Spirochaetales bacterium]|nr:MAG: ribosomal-processing cysteine protease Prp [Spirochaetales bacterium]
MTYQETRYLSSSTRNESGTSVLVVIVRSTRWCVSRKSPASVISVQVFLDDRGVLKELDVTGHASLSTGPRGGNVVCAAVTGIGRSCVAVIVARSEIRSSGSAPAEGELRLSLTDIPDATLPWLDGVTQVLLSGVQRIADEAPGEVAFDVRKERS